MNVISMKNAPCGGSTAAVALQEAIDEENITILGEEGSYIDGRDLHRGLHLQVDLRVYL